MKNGKTIILLSIMFLLIGTCTPVCGQRPMFLVAFYEEAPYQFVGENGVAAGLLIDLFDQVAERAGYRAEYHRYATLNACVEALEQGEADLVLGMPSSSGHQMPETAELYASKLVIAASSSFAESGRTNRGYRVGYNYQTTEDTIIYSLIADRYIVSDRVSSLMEYLREGQIDAAILDKAVLDYAQENSGQTMDFVVTNQHLDTVQYTIACRPKDNSLLRTLNTAILDLRIGGDYPETISRWIAEERERDWLTVLKWVSAATAILIGGFLIYSVIGYRVRRLLQEQILEKTQELTDTNSQLKRQMEQLQFEGKLRSRLIENAKNGMIMIDGSSRILLMNYSAKRMAGFPPVGENCTVDMLPCFREVLAQVQDDLSEPGFRVDNKQVAVQAADGLCSYYRLNIHQIVESGQVSGALITLENITREQRMMQESLEAEKNRVLNQIIAGIAHEIKNPLMAIHTYASLIHQKHGDANFLHSFGEFVPKEADRINHLIESLVSYARPIKGIRTEIDLCALVRECTYLSQVAQRKIQVSVNLQAASIYANPDQIKQVLINLMLNGIESMEEKAVKQPDQKESLRLTVSVERRGDIVFIQVKDTGMGMTETMRQRCTELFYTTKERGSGLGLALSEQFILENGGQMEISSTRGEYTRITIRFPAAGGQERRKEREDV